MKALSLYQPWALLVVLGVKRYETRAWSTPYRGPLAIHASRSFPDAARALCERAPVRDLLREAGFLDKWELPRGVVLGTVELLDCLPVEELPPLDDGERSLGDFRPGRFAWLLGRPQRFAVPRLQRGWPGLFTIPDCPSPER